MWAEFSIKVTASIKLEGEGVGETFNKASYEGGSASPPFYLPFLTEKKRTSTYDK